MLDIFFVDADGGVTVVDVKAPHKRNDPEVKALMRWTARTVTVRGCGFEEAQLVEDVGDVGLDGALGQEQPGCYLPVAEAARDKLGDLPVPCG